MPWKESNEMSQRIEFVMKAEKNKDNFSELCREFNISRTLGYRLLSRYQEYGLEGIAPYSRRPHGNPNKTDEDIVCEIVKLRIQHSNWGGKTIRAVLLRSYPSEKIPSARTIDRILQRSSLVRKRRKRTGKYLPDGEIIVPKKPNEVWTVDFKGWWKTKNGETCFPLTIRDEHSRYVLNLSAHKSPSFKPVKEQFKRCFETYGLPDYIRSDNGGPFAAVCSIQGLSQLSSWWVSLSVLPNRIKPASPYMNGAHERMHRDIKHDLQSNPEKNIESQQEAFNKWLDFFNCERPHQALQMRTPSECYVESSRKYDPAEPEYGYPCDYETRKVGCRGHIYWKSKKVFISNALTKRRIGIKKERDEKLSVWFCELFLGETSADFSLPLGEGRCNKNRVY